MKERCTILDGTGRDMALDDQRYKENEDEVTLTDLFEEMDYDAERIMELITKKDRPTLA